MAEKNELADLIIPMGWLKEYCRQGHSLSSAILHEQFRIMLQKFIKANEDPKTSANFHSKDQDEIRLLIKILRVKECKRHSETVLTVLQALKVLSRKRLNRRQLTENDIRSILRLIEEPLNDDVTAACANVILNICYERENAEAVIRGGGSSLLLNLLNSSDKDILANACGAIQSVCFQAEGRHSIREAEGISPLIAHIKSSNAKVRSRAVGALHNMSSDAESIRLIRKGGAVAKLVSLLEDKNGIISGSAAGALQNLSREVASRRIILDLDAIPTLVQLLVEKNINTQVCASGALLNLIGPMIDNSIHQGKKEFSESELQQRKGFCRIMSLCIALSSIVESVFGT